MMRWNNIRADDVHDAVASIFELSNTMNWTPSEFYIACRMITHFLEREYGVEWLDEAKFIKKLSEFEAE